MKQLGLLATLIAGAIVQTPGPGIDGTWRGTLGPATGGLRLVLQISKAPDGVLSGTLQSIDQNATLPIDVIQVTGDTVRIDVKTVNGSFEGTLNPARTEIKGTWTQGAPRPLTFTRDTSAPSPAAPTDLNAAKPITATTFPLGLPLDLHVPVPPTPFVGGDGKRYLVYEVHVTNFAGRPLTIARLDVIAGGTTLGGYDGQTLNAMMRLPSDPASQDRRTVPDGRRAVAYIWIEASDAAPAFLTHRITVGEATVDGGTIAVSPAPPITIGPPLKGSNWRAVNGPGPGSGHRRAIIPVEGGLHIAQRFAIDFVKIGDDGRTFTGDQKTNASYHAYGADAIAVANGVVVAVKDGIPENVPGPTSRAVPITLETIGGNHVVIDLGGGRYAFYAHLQPGSLRVKVGDHVNAGRVVGLVGNSGNSTEPHLHFHITNGPSPLGSEGLPYAITGMTGMPLQNARVDFGK